MPKRSLGIGGPLKLIETTRSHTFFSPLHWLTLVSLTRHALQHRRALRFIRSSRSACFAPITLATIQRTSRVESEHIRTCAWRGYRRGDVGERSFTSFPPSRRVRFTPKCRHSAKIARRR